MYYIMYIIVLCIVEYVIYYMIEKNTDSLRLYYIIVYSFTILCYIILYRPFLRFQSDSEERFANKVTLTLTTTP